MYVRASPHDFTSSSGLADRRRRVDVLVDVEDEYDSMADGITPVVMLVDSEDVSGNTVVTSRWASCAIKYEK
jgi:hypothetical protein